MKENSAPLCKMCDNHVKMNYNTHQWRIYCSRACQHTDSATIYEKMKTTNKLRYGVEHNSQHPTSIDKKKKTWITNYGVDNPLKSQDIRSKISQTNLEKYGKSSPLASDDIRQKANNTNLKKYGTYYPTQNTVIRDKISQTNIEKYGASSPLASGDIRQKIKETWIEKYGVDNPRKSSIIQAKIKQTWLEKYGVDNPLKSSLIKHKAKQTNQLLYGTEFKHQSHIIDMLPNLKNFEWLYQQYITEEKSATQIACENGGIHYTTILRYLRHQEITIRHQYNHSYKSIQWLDSITEQEGINIQHALNGGEYQIPNTRYKADGYCAETNTIYEFYGDYWHGNPDVYESELINESTNCTMGELYQKTIDRERMIRSLGYNIITKWESC